jgi:hypothetical protein
MLVWNIAILLAVAAATWWLTGVDKTTGGESKRSHYYTRALRIVTVVFLVAVFLVFIRDRGGGMGGIVLLLIIPISIALVLRSSLAEVFSHSFLRLVDPAFHDDRELDSKRDGRYLDTIAHLIKNGRKDEAIRLCEELKKDGELDAATLDMTLEFLGVKQTQAATQSPSSRAASLISQGDLAGAEAVLKPLLAKNPADVQTAMMLMRLYAQNFRQPDKAWTLLRNLEKHPHVASAHIDFARRSIEEWSRNDPPESIPAAPAEPRSLDDLLAEKSYGSAVEMLEQNIKEQPRDLGLRLKLAEVHALCCHNFPRAEKIIRQLEADRCFNAGQVAAGKAKLKEWQETAIQRK